MRKKKKGGRVKLILTNLLLVCCVVVFAISIWKLVGYLTEYNRGEESYTKLMQHVTVPEVKKNKKGEKVIEAPTVDWEELQKVNDDLVGWIYISGTDVQYPVVQGDNNEHYLSYTFEGKKNNCGSIFMDVENQADYSSENTILYGHNMKTGKMFGSLSFYKDKKYWKEHPIIWVVTKDKAFKYEIFSVYETESTSDVYQTEFSSEDEKQAYVESCKNNSLYDTGIEIETTHQILTLSTCTSVTEEGRFIVQAKLVAEEEIENEQ